MTALSPEARSRLTTLRVSAHVGNVIVRRQGSDWIAAGADGCSVKPRRVERALDNLSALKALPSNDRPADGSSFELQIVALIGQERALHFDVADRKPEGDLVQLTDDSTFRVQGLDRSLWSPDPTVWCAEP